MRLLAILGKFWRKGVLKLSNRWICALRISAVRSSAKQGTAVSHASCYISQKGSFPQSSPKDLWIFVVQTALLKLNLPSSYLSGTDYGLATSKIVIVRTVAVQHCTRTRARISNIRVTSSIKVEGRGQAPPAWRCSPLSFVLRPTAPLPSPLPRPSRRSDPEGSPASCTTIGATV